MGNLILYATRPDRLISNKDEKYDSEMARYCIYAGDNDIRQKWAYQSWINYNFWANNQWILNEDLETFLKDEGNQSKNRIMTTINTIFRQIAQFMGNAKNLNLNIGAENLSYKAINRREEKLAETLHFQEVANYASEPIKEFIKSKYPIGNSKEETEDIFNNLFTDEYTKAVKNLIQYVFKEEKIMDRKETFAFDLALSGLGVGKYDIYNNNFKIRQIPSQSFYWDTSALEYDLSDSEFMWHIENMLPSTIYEKYRVAKDIKERIEQTIKNTLNQFSNNSYISNGRVPVYHIEWKDFEEVEFGYVKDEFDYPYLTKINFTYPNEDLPRYTDKNLIPVEQLNDVQKELLKGSNKGTLTLDVVRYAHLIPSEVISGNKNEDRHNDIILESGVLKHSDSDTYRLCNINFSYKAHCWYYWQGLIYTPISNLINPQRMINRTASVIESLVNTTTPANLWYDKSMMTMDGGEKKALKNRYQGKMIGVDAKGRGINNAVQIVGSSLDINSLTFNSNRIAELMSIQDKTVGLNEEIRGEGTGSEQLVGVTAINIQRASLIQEPFYSAITKIYTQLGQAVANVARPLYANDERKMAIILGDKSASIINLAKEYSIEAFRVFINQEPDIKRQIEMSNARLDQMLIQGIINKEVHADLYNRATAEDIAEAIREMVKKDREIAKAQAEAESQGQAQQQQMIQQVMADTKQQEQTQRVDNIVKEQLDRENKIQQKSIQKQPQQTA